MNLTRPTLIKDVAVYLVFLTIAALVGYAAGLILELLLLATTLTGIFLFLQMTFLAAEHQPGRNRYRFLFAGSTRHLQQKFNSNKRRISELETSVALSDKALQRAEADATTSLQAFRDSLSALPDALIALDRNNRIEWWNNAATELFSLSHSLDKNKRIEVVINNERFRTYAANLAPNRAIEIRSPTAADKLLSVQMVRYGEGKKLLQAKDQTHLRQLEQIRQDFIANTSHELRTPLTVVHGYIETLMDHPHADETSTLADTLTAMYRQTSRIKNIVEDMLTLSRLEQDARGPSEMVDMVRLLNSARDEATMLSGDQGHKVSIEAQTGFLLLGNQEEIRSLVANLVSNAIRYTTAGGEIALRWWIDDNGAYFTVTDTGIGIAPSQISRITERFYRVDTARSRETGGTGLGLAIVKHVLTRMGGELSIASAPGTGSTFTCLFPRLSVRRIST